MISSLKEKLFKDIRPDIDQYNNINRKYFDDDSFIRKISI